MQAPLSSAHHGKALFFRASVSLGFSLLLCLGCGKAEKGPEYEIERSYASGPVHLKVQVSKRSITIAEKLTLVLEATAPSAVDVELPRLGERLQEFGISECLSPPPELAGEDLTRRRQVYALEPFLSGAYEIPPLCVKFREKGRAGEPGEISTDAFRIQVKSLLPSDLKKLEIRDISGPEAIPLPWGWRTVTATVCGLFLLAGAGLLLWLRRRGASGEARARRPAHEIACAELAALLKEDLVGVGRVKEFYGRVSGILRHYIENRFGLRAPERTTEEFLPEVEASALLEPSWKAILRRFLQHCDMVKFAEHQPSGEEIQRAYDTCEEFIEATREREEKVEPQGYRDTEDASPADS